VKLLVATPEALKIPVMWFVQGLVHYKLDVVDEIVITTTRGNLGMMADQYSYMSKAPRTPFSTDRIPELMRYIDGALFIWDGVDQKVNTLRNWTHSVSKPYIDWIIETKDHT
jgi:hypothetical protein